MLPEFAEDIDRRSRNDDMLAPYVEAALARKRWMRPLTDDEIPVVRLSVATAQTGGGRLT